MMGRQTVSHAAHGLPLHRAARVSTRAVRHISLHAPLSPCGEHSTGPWGWLLVATSVNLNARATAPENLT